MELCMKPRLFASQTIWTWSRGRLFCLSCEESSASSLLTDVWRNTNIHILVLLTQWYDNLSADFKTHTRLCNGVKFYDSTQNFANTALWFAAKLPFTPPPPSTLWARSLAFTSSHLSAFYQPLLPLLAPYFFHPIHPTTMLFILSFLSLLASLFSSSPTSICPSVSAFLFKYFTFIIFYFFFQFSLSCPPLFPLKHLTCFANIWFY